MNNKIKNRLTINKAFKLIIFVLLEAPILLLLLGNIHNVPLFGFFMSAEFSGALTDTGDDFYTPTNLINDFYTGSMHFYLIIPVLIVAKLIHSKYGKKIDAFLRRFS
ncbi:TPA: hypothetical protein ACHVWS_004855 [Klebsiella pneumoniae]|uniref:Uncharacterized protein n=1 Tax=Salmonella enterica subsp. enterica serovar Braenderup TaxID=149391 RepID=A0A634Z3R7_SALET|nr:MULTISPECIES: hypothetical protein [Enterobacteriaceae]EAA1764939.1 hypothetical protein [Salmonella enterica subsp. enterica serovar Braenderup]EAP7992596.1 hypothetical protein [Salmonella enterica]EBX5149371.1 hypothetical protein [Salmonella enterica subsp. enterica serovar Poona]ECA8425384.1 hypothetical protein [Salmonella enterica subsp. enterica serovar Livingstone]ECZ3653473.1 hypothetical protein [Salmonella enterica subsp. enterica serovar Chailey]EDH0540926.1 hypothetical prote